MADADFRLPSSSFEAIQRILESYVASRGPAKLDDVAQRAAMGRTQVSGNNAFLTSINLIEGGNIKSLTELGRDVGLATSYPGSPEYTNAWRKVVESSEHLQKIVDAVRIRRGMTTEALETHILLTAGIPKSTTALTGARAIVDLLRAAGRIVESDGTITVSSAPDEDDLRPSLLSTAQPPVEHQPAAAAISRSNVTGEITVNLTINIAVDAASIAELPDQLLELLKKLRQPDHEEEDV